MLRYGCRSWLLAASLALAGPAAAGTEVSGRSAQALRCAAYIAMTAQYGYDEGRISAGDRDLLTTGAFLVLDRWVPLAPEDKAAAYRGALVELGSRDRTYLLVARHADWCLSEFTPAL